jgi:folate-binding Fe-S cluster repair protein YgfZ
MEHRGTARRRFILVQGKDSLPAAGTPILAGERALGTLGSSVGSAGLALVRLDRAREAMDADAAVTAAGVRLTLSIPAWATFGWPIAAAADD